MNTSKIQAVEKIDFERFSTAKFNTIFRGLSPKDRLKELYKYFSEDEVLFTSSFGTNSAYLLHLLSTVNPKQKVHFINTGYLFEETVRYKNELAERFGLEIVELVPRSKEHNMTNEEQWWNDHPKMCCAINKIAPLDREKAGKKIWVSGVLGFQTDFRSDLGIFAPHGDLYKFHPLIDLKEGQFLYDLNYHDLPKHPLANFGYGSVGCTHCTVKGEGRDGRWADSEKTECGLHTHYFTNKNDLNESK